MDGHCYISHPSPPGALDRSGATNGLPHTPPMPWRRLKEKGGVEEETAFIEATQSFTRVEDVTSIGYIGVAAQHSTTPTRHYAASLTP